MTRTAAPEATAGARRLHRARLRGVLAIAGITLVLVALVEGGARAYWHRRVRSSLQDYAALGADGRWRPRAGFRNAHVEVNTLGFRGPEIDPEKPPDTFRIVALGDSVTWGFTVPGAEAYPDRLAARLNGLGTCDQRIEILNAGVPGYQTRHVRDRLGQEVRPLRPDLVLVLSGWNDIWSDNPANPAKRLNPHSLLNRLLQVSFALRAVVKVGFDSRPVVRDVSPTTRATYESFFPVAFVQSYEELLDVAQEMNVPAVALTLPSLLGEARPDTLGARLHFPHFTTSPELLTVLWMKYNTALKDLTRRRNVAVIDLARDMASSPGANRFFIDTNHLTPEGADLVAAHVALGLIERRLVPCVRP